jgi:hypothetical protein
MKGWLFIEPQAEYLKTTHQANVKRAETFILLHLQPPPITPGAFPITHSIKDQEFLKIYGEWEGVKINANFNTVNNVQDGDNGAYEIKGGRFNGTGTFVNVTPKEHADFKMFFLCHSNSPNGLFLRWEVGINEIIDAQGAD